MVKDVFVVRSAQNSISSFRAAIHHSTYNRVVNGNPGRNVLVTNAISLFS